jgi:hypothetical protein
MEKVDGVDKVRVSLNDGLTILDLKPANTITLARLRQIIKNNGFVSKDATVVARGHLNSGNGARIFEVGGTGEELVPSGETQQTGEQWRLTVQR